MKIHAVSAVLALAGLTAASPTPSKQLFTARQAPCDGTPCSRENAQIIVTSLKNIGQHAEDTLRVGPSTWTLIMSQSDCSLWAQSKTESASSWAVDLATGAQVILDAAGTCHPTNLVSGFNTANGNGDYLMYLGAAGSPPEAAAQEVPQ